MIGSIGDLERIKGKFLPEIGIREDTDAGRISEKARILVCGGTGCVSGGSDKVMKRFTSEIEKRNIDAKIIRTGCHGFCEKGPLAVVCPGKVLYTNVKEEDVGEIIEQHVLNGKVVERLLYM